MAGLAAPREAILEPALPILDPHHHLWYRQTDLASLPPVTRPYELISRISPRYLFDELRADLTSGHNIRASIFLECHSMYRADGPTALRPVGETEFVNGVAAMFASGDFGDLRACAGIIGHADLTLAETVDEVLEAHLAAGGGRFCGVRQMAAHDEDVEGLGGIAGGPEGVYLSDGFRAGFTRFARFGLPFDAWVLEPQLDDVIDLARAFPETTIVLDHLGSPLGIGAYAGRLQERFGTWRDKMRTLGACENAVVKIGGLGMPFPGLPSLAAQPPAPSTKLAEEWRPYVETCIDAFGVERSMFESNWPVDSTSCTYAVLWNTFKVLAGGCSADEKSALFSGTAGRVYGLTI